jgi:hypothetical protein
MAPDRLTLLAITVRRSAGDVEITSVKVGPKDAVQMVTETNGNTRVSLFAAFPDPAEEIASIVVKVTPAAENCGLAIYRATGVKTAPTSRFTVKAGALTGSLNVFANGAALAVAYTDAPATFNWAGLTEDMTFNGGGAWQQSSASSKFTAAQAGLTISATPSTAVSQVMIGASWGRDARAPDRLCARSCRFLILGGPAGSAFAILAARAGASVAIVERHGFADDRPGEQIAGTVRGALDALAIPAAAGALLSAPSQGIVSLWAGEAPLTKAYRSLGQPEALRVVRNRFDAMLFDIAGWPVRSFSCRRPCTVPAADAAAQRRWSQLKAIISHCLPPRSSTPGRVACLQPRPRCPAQQPWRHVRVGGLAARNRARARRMLDEACPCGWWSATATPNEQLVVSLFTSAAMMKSARTGLDDWWRGVLSLLHIPVNLSAAATFNPVACVSFQSFRRFLEDAWPRMDCGRRRCGGVRSAVRSRRRVRARKRISTFEAMSAGAGSARSAPLYQSAITDRYRRHLMRRAEVYAEAADSLSTAFMVNGVGAAAAS